MPQDDPALHGSWSATRWQYAARDRHEFVVDVVTGLRGSVTISLTTGAYVLSWDIPGGGPGSVGGSAVMTEGLLLLQPFGSERVEALRYHIAGQTLSLHAEASRWDFDGQGEMPAELVAVLVRL